VKNGLIALALVAGCGLAASAGAAIPKDQYTRQLEQAQGRYKGDNDTCKKLAGNARDICQVEARGNYNVAKAELRAQYQPTPKNQDKARLAKAEAALRLATEKCEDMTGNARDVCKLDAKALYVAAKSETELNRATVDKGMNSRQANNERKEARDDIGQAQWVAAKGRCDALTGDAKVNCIGDARKKFGKM
jgi:hypothetical protein